MPSHTECVSHPFRLNPKTLLKRPAILLDYFFTALQCTQPFAFNTWANYAKYETRAHCYLRA